MKLVPSLGMQRRKPGSVGHRQYTQLNLKYGTNRVRIKLACGSTRVTQKWEPHVVSSCVCVDPEEVDVRDFPGLLFGLPFICTSGVLAMLAG